VFERDALLAFARGELAAEEAIELAQADVDASDIPGDKTPKIGVVVLDANPKAKDWKKIVAAECLEFGTSTTTEASDLLAGPITVCFCFYLNRPACHYKTNGELNAQGLRNPYPVVRPDVLKLARAVEDALTGIVYKDDSQIVSEFLHKRYCEPNQEQGVLIQIKLKVR